MAIAPTLQKYLDQNVTYEVIPHEPTLSSMRTAEACHISGDGLAKGIVLRRDDGYMLAVLPASHHIRLSDLRRQIGNDVDMRHQHGGISPLFGAAVRKPVRFAPMGGKIAPIVTLGRVGGGDSEPLFGTVGPTPFCLAPNVS